MRKTPPRDILAGKLRAVVLLTALFCSASSARTLTIVSWGGVYEDSQTRAYFEPFTRQTGIQIRVEQNNGGIDELRRQVESEHVTWDVVDLVKSDSLQACESDLLEPIDHSQLLAAPDGTAAVDDFYEGALGRCSVGEVVYATVLAFDPRAFPGRKPQSVTALFNLEDFPGKRALQRRPIAILEWALLSYGVPHQDIYNLLSTERGIELAFKRLDRIKTDIVWWENGGEPVRLLAAGQVVMASGYNGRFFNAAFNEGQPIEIVWDGQLYDYSVWGIPRGSPNTDLAMRFIRYATTTESLADQARYISYGPARRSSSALIWRHDDTGIDIRPHLPTYPANFKRAIRRDHEWYARMHDRLEKRFSKWLEK